MLINARKTDLDELLGCRLVLEAGKQGAEAGREGIKRRESEKERESERERERMIKSKTQRQNKFQQAHIGAISGMTQVCAWPASSDCGMGIRSNFLYICHLLGMGFLFPAPTTHPHYPGHARVSP